MSYEITRPELVWPGKYDDEGKRKHADRVSLPFQVIERVNESRATREAEKSRNLTLFDVWKGDDAETFEDGWRNKLIWGDNRLVMSSLLDQFAGKVDLIYIDPPFATGADFSITVPVGDDGTEIDKEQSLIEEKAYRDTWGAGTASYMSMLYERLVLMRELLSPSGQIYVHMGAELSHLVRSLLDEIFGVEHYRNEIIWCFSGGGISRNDFPRKHEVILRYARGDAWFYEHEYKPYKENTQQVGKVSTYNLGRRESLDIDLGRGTPVTDWWTDINTVTGWAPEKLGYPTQKPEALLERIIKTSSRAGDLVADFFSGSGTTQAVAERLGRRWIAADLGRFAVHTARKRLLAIEDCKPFEVLNLGKYERKYWAVATFGEDLDHDGVVSLYEYIAFVLKLYGASPVSGLQHLHGKKGGAFVHVGAVDSPVTIDEIVACVDEAVALRATEVHVLGWEWEMGLHDPVADEAKRRGVHLVLRQIPREAMEEQAAAKGDVDFYELAYLDVRTTPTKKERGFQVRLENFIIPNPELVPDDVRPLIAKWSDYVDYWAVDWDFRDDTFMQGWVTYRTRQDRTLDLVSDPHSYTEPGTYNVMVKVIDIFGNDTSRIIEVAVK